MRSYFYFLPFLFLPLFLNGQHQKWVNIVNDNKVNCVAFEDDFIWAGTDGGIVRINRETGEKKSYLPSDIGGGGFGIKTIFISNDKTKWIGTKWGGLLRFDGEHWEQYYHINTGDTLHQINEIKSTPNGDIWIVSSSYYNYLYHNKLFRFDGTSFTRMDSVLGPNMINSFDIAPDGTLWGVTNNKLTKYDSSLTTELFNYPNTVLEPDEIFKLVKVINDNEVIVATYKNYRFRIFKFDGTAWTNITPIAFTNGNPFHVGTPVKMTLDINGSLYFQHTKGLIKYDNSDWEILNPNELGIPSTNTYPDLLAISGNGNLWLNEHVPEIQLPKLVEFDGINTKKYSTEIFPLFTNSFRDVAFDCEDKIWLGATKGLISFDGYHLEEYKNEDLETPISTWSMTFDTSTCTLWTASYNTQIGGYGLVGFDGNNYTKYHIGGHAFKVEFDQEENLWVAAYTRGLGKFDGFNWTWYDDTNSPLLSIVEDIDIDALGVVWIATFGGGVFSFDGNNWWEYNESNSIVNNYLTMIYVDRLGYVWTHDEGSLLRFNGNQWEKFVIGNGNWHVNSIIQDHLGNYWVGTSGGVFFWDGDSSFIHYHVGNSAIGQNFVYKIRIDPYGNKWIIHHEGVSIFNENGISTRTINPPNSLRGQVFFDVDQDGSKASNGEPGIPGEGILLLPDSLMTYSTFGGQYVFHPTPGNYEINFQPNAPAVPTTPSQINLLMGSNDQNGLDFGAWMLDPPDSISVDATASNARCNETTTLWINVTNHGNGLLPVKGTVQLTTYPSLEFISANQTPESIAGNVITWEYNNLYPYEYEQIKVTFQSPSEDAIGEKIEFNVVATQVENGDIIQSAKDYTNTEVRCSFDPNDKKSEATGDYLGSLSLLSDPLDFTIRFQNKGNDTAFVVVIRDTLDADLDPASFELITFSHHVRPTMTADGVLTFVFENIDLLWESFDEPASHGFVKYRIAPRGNLPDPTEIKNTAHIYFDFNPAIVTNTTENTLVKMLPVTFTEGVDKKETDIILYPNPTTNGFWAEWTDPAFSNNNYNVNIFDAAGKIYFSKNSTEKKIWVGDLNAGFYVVVFENNGRRFSKKLVVTGR